jgi:hypothetical protein
MGLVPAIAGIHGLVRRHHLNEFLDEMARRLSNHRPIQTQTRRAARGLGRISPQTPRMSPSIAVSRLGVSLFEPVRRRFNHHTHQDFQLKFIAVIHEFLDLVEDN